MRAALLLFIFTVTANAQWQIQDSHTTADLRGIDNVGNGIAWASGSNGTVLRTTDNGSSWQRCATPPDADKLDFRGVQAFDAQTAIVMSSGKGDLSRLYKTTDGCKTWKLVFSNPDKNGFWDAIQITSSGEGWLLGDPVNGKYFLAEMQNGETFRDLDRRNSEFSEADALKTEAGAVFAASNTALLVSTAGGDIPTKSFGRNCRAPILWFAAEEHGSAKIYRFDALFPQCSDYLERLWTVADVPVGGNSDTAGIFSIATDHAKHIVAVGGDYSQPQQEKQTAAFSSDDGKRWLGARQLPHGYRSSVAYYAATKTWITVGPNGTDVSTDDGRNWRALRPSAGDAPDADKNWNALSLPFVVGPKGRIGVLEAQALKAK